MLSAAAPLIPNTTVEDLLECCEEEHHSPMTVVEGGQLHSASVVVIFFTKDCHIHTPFSNGFPFFPTRNNHLLDGGALMW